MGTLVELERQSTAIGAAAVQEREDAVRDCDQAKREAQAARDATAVTVGERDAAAADRDQARRGAVEVRAVTATAVRERDTAIAEFSVRRTQLRGKLARALRGGRGRC